MGTTRIRNPIRHLCLRMTSQVYRCLNIRLILLIRVINQVPPSQIKVHLLKGSHYHKKEGTNNKLMKKNLHGKTW